MIIRRSFLLILFTLQFLFGACNAWLPQSGQDEFFTAWIQQNATSTKAVAEMQSADAGQAAEYTCQPYTFSANLFNDFSAQAAQVKMIDENTVEFEMWMQRPLSDVAEYGIPTQTPDQLTTEYPPIDYERVTYDLLTSEYTVFEHSTAPFQNNICYLACEQKTLSDSPDREWQLILVTQAKQTYLNGIWLVHRNYFQRLVAPFDEGPNYPLGQTWWRWQSDSSGLFLRYRGIGEYAEIPLSIDLQLPPAYHFLLEGVHLGPGMFNTRSIALNDDTGLLYVYGPIVRNDGSKADLQWYLYDILSGNLYEATPNDFSKLARYVWVEDTEPRLIRWDEQQQQQWLADHPNEDIWSKLGNRALFEEPYQMSKGTLRLPQITNLGKSLQIIDCIPADALK